ncbi:Cof-like hydrolase OS=Tsukamurella paurometabola (strain ATCC 8368 / DSM / CCUG 35730 / CIP 100753 / JCM 10117 / KCTC 9821 / NBRC 16120 / NCIMB 702349 /NCTC 13040) OX=521096 GN=Tpau_0158 PE=4 SV=1 [Tsukamurella paurometabola]|uniref:Cof-like hydrolase n=1 Tax=Tsukamurella paurometabola (strain ATCC 8368 / DSM 20162 / CCUG 35730 / CIP 100753 / JCM 10117 / KCTC 9821 / NBRC 16120 / NCIMB 702349 / NCTC 13040) TaxID=521096 RepID=D5UQ44_TSUPD|nr:HAD family hydrolase [Tsukamurella paurometabola]ADG76812.1 Cof-like hydrolase [Tsukamurella paurometabola DSM 20162]SUP41740.1 Phosphatase YidA [Tsukamurella paurometabola]
MPDAELGERPVLVASDVDGTLVDEAEKISPRTHAALHAVRAAGGHFVLATGRPPRAVDPIADQLDFAPLAVCANGAVLYDTGTSKVVSAALMSPDLLAHIAELVYEHLPGAGFAAERVAQGEHDAATPRFAASTGYQHAWLEPETVSAEDAVVLSHPAVKLLVRQPGMTSDEMHARVAPHLAGIADVTYATNNGLIEFHVPGVTKATGIRAAMRHLGLSDDVRTAAFGDMPNDAEMLRWAGVGVAMANAHPVALDAANMVTSTNLDDGVAQILERWF